MIIWIVSFVYQFGSEKCTQILYLQHCEKGNRMLERGEAFKPPFFERHVWLYFIWIWMESRKNQGKKFLSWKNYYNTTMLGFNDLQHQGFIHITIDGHGQSATEVRKCVQKESEKWQYTDLFRCHFKLIIKWVLLPKW